MRSLASFVMRGRSQAAMILVVAGVLPLLNLFSGAALALVTLRRGALEGLLTLLLSAAIAAVLTRSASRFSHAGCCPIGIVLVTAVGLGGCLALYRFVGPNPAFRGAANGCGPIDFRLDGWRCDGMGLQST
ncbi:MAG: hypothetical protein R3F37_01045 [Candidatus Competibacteraceae bacterium]